MLDFTIDRPRHILGRKLEVVKIPNSATEAPLFIKLFEYTLLGLTRILNDRVAVQRCPASSRVSITHQEFLTIQDMQNIQRVFIGAIQSASVCMKFHYQLTWLPGGSPR